MRRMVVWMVTVPLAVIGSQVGHALAYRLVVPDNEARTHELAATGHAYLAYAPVGLAVCATLILIALAVELAHVVARRPVVALSPLPFAVLAPTIFVCQEYFERLLHDGSFPWDAAFAPTFLVGLLLQLPFVVAAYVIARLFLGVVRALGGHFRARRRPWVHVPSVTRPVGLVAGPRLAVLSRGFGSRGPPVLRS